MDLGEASIVSMGTLVHKALSLMLALHLLDPRCVR
jgi:hypothetical protein